jgi:hypothetical protein
VPSDVFDVPQPVIAQMTEYRLLLAHKYPDKTLRCSILYSAAPRIISLPDKMLQHSLQK